VVVLNVFYEMDSTLGTMLYEDVLQLANLVSGGTGQCLPVPLAFPERRQES
jgi:hypothetical protein